VRVRSQKGITIEVTKTKGNGVVPGFVSIGHRHLQKERPEGKATHNGVAFTIPTDLLEKTIPTHIVEEIEEVTFVYAK
jgi:hypothetical protein